ncbi:MAG: polysaccharide deacetylase family protein [Coriobacteriales bacterium]|nr:polysaccharide deacetylase family protein [Coriobacteriales bacterium]
MTDTQHDEEPTASHEDSQSYNPYEAADPIPVHGYPRSADTPKQKPGFSAPRRSRTIQSARDAVYGGQQALGHVDETGGASSPIRGDQEGPYAQRPKPQRATLVGTDTSLPKLDDSGNSHKRRFPIKPFPAIPIAILVLVVVLVIARWPKQSVAVTINGKSAEVPVGSTLKEVMDNQGIVVNPGDYVTVSGNLIIAHNGYAFSAQLNGKDLSQDEIDAYHVQGSESITFSDGKDRLEDCDIVTETIEPYLRMEGNGYDIQYVSQWAQEGTLEHREGRISGEKADVVTKEAQDCIVTCRRIELDEDHPYVALTFDDGPADPYTEQYLDILAEHGARATFFCLGDSVEQYPELAQRVVGAGHQLANHTMAHNQLTSVPDATVRDEIERSAAVIEGACGVATTHLRPPYGDFTERSWLASGGTITAAVRWSGDSQDWRLPGADAIVENLLAGVRPGSILLMHDGGGDRSQDVEALPKVIERLQEDGYELVTVSELLRAAGDIPEEVCSGTGTMPEGAVWPEQIAPEDIAASGGTIG